ncbi:MAG: magnesium transporter CorA family protein [Chloroflexota bacterium]
MAASETNFYQIPHNSPPKRLESYLQALEPQEKGCYVWLDYFQPEKEDLLALIEPLNLHPLSIEDCLDKGSQIPNMDDYGGNTFIIFNDFDHCDHTMSIHELDVFIGDQFLVTVRHHINGASPFLQEVERFFIRNSESMHQGPAFLLHFILDQVVDKKFITIEAIEDELNEAEDAILSDLKNFNPAELLDLRRDLLAIRKSLFHEREILVKICRLDSPFISKKAIFFYRDIYDHLSKFFELTESSRDIVTSLMEIYLSMLNNQMARAANNTNVTVRRLTYITTIFMPLTLLASIGGMSEWSMITGPQNWKLSYSLFLLGLVVLGVITWLLLQWWEKKRGKED